MVLSDRWLKAPPALGELISGTSFIGKPKDVRPQTAIIIPVDCEYDCLASHLGALERQNTSEFDVIIVHSPQTGVSTIGGARPFGIHLLALKENLGAGAYYVGELFALENDYRHILLADVDAVPLDDGLVGRLSGLCADSGDAVFLPSLKSGGGAPIKSWSIHWYSAVSRSVLQKSGLTYLPLFFGGEDAELELRMRKAGIRFQYIDDAFVDHPRSKQLPLKSTYERAIYDFRNRGLMLFHAIPQSWPAVPLSHAFFALCLFDRADRFSIRMRIAAGAIADILSLRLFRMRKSALAVPPYPETTLGEAAKSPPPARAILSRRYLGEKRESLISIALSGHGIPRDDPLYESAANPILFSAGLARLAIENKALIICSDWKYLFNPALLLCPRVFLHDGDKTWLVYDEENPLSRLARFFLSLSAMALLAGAYLPVSFIAYLRLNGAMRRYGIKQAVSSRRAKHSSD